MSNQQILEKAIQKATKAAGMIQLSDGSILLPDREYLFDKTSYALIFNHEFCKALWPNDDFKTTLKFGTEPLMRWQYNLAQMILAEDPLIYLGEHLD